LAKVYDLNAYKEVCRYSDTLSRIMNDRGLTQERLGNEAGIDRSVISRWKNGRRHVQPQDAANLALVLHSEELLDSYCEHCPVVKARKRIREKMGHHKEIRRGRR